MMKLQYSPINQCWFLIWGSQVIETYGTKQDAKIDLRYKGLGLQIDGTVTAMEDN